jgi:non-specific serine/threonine protein kinase
LSNPTARLQRYNPETDNWKLLTQTQRPRAAHTIEALDGKLYTIGGVREQQTYGGPPTATMSIYNIAADKWKSGPPMSVPREHRTGVALDGRIWAIAGRNWTGGGTNLAAFERYNPATGDWKTLPDVQVPRSGIASGTAHGKIVVFGGEELSEGDSTIKEVEVYDRSTSDWTDLPDMITPRHGLGGASYQGVVYALEGGPMPAFSFSDALEYLEVPE